jgi:hypothetical protein
MKQKCFYTIGHIYFMSLISVMMNTIFHLFIVCYVSYLWLSNCFLYIRSDVSFANKSSEYEKRGMKSHPFSTKI